MFRISQAGLDFIKGFESFVPYVYDDKVAAQRVGGRLVYREWKRGDPIRGTLTIGYGHTDAAQYNLGFDLASVPPGFRLSEADACAILDVDLDECEADVRRLVRVDLSQGQFDALVSLVFNMGAGNLIKSTLLAKLNHGDYAGARNAFDLYVYSKGERMPGLQRRRDGEQALWDSDVPPSPVDIVDHPAEVDRDPTPPPPESMAESSEGNAAVIVGGINVAVVGNEIGGAMTKVVASGKPFSIAEFLLQLTTSGTFWGGVLSMVLCSYIWRRRRDWLRALGMGG